MPALAGRSSSPLPLGASVFGFTLLLRASTALIDIPTRTWQLLSGGLLVGLGLVAIFPAVWDRFAVSSGMGASTAGRLSVAGRRGGWVGAALTGVALGPVFTSCSPLYAYVVVTVLPASPARGLVLLTAYVIGLCAILLAVGLVGQRLIRRLRWAADPHSPLRRIVGIVFVVLGVLILTGTLQNVEAWVLEYSPIAPWQLGAGLGR